MFQTSTVNQQPEKEINTSEGNQDELAKDPLTIRSVFLYDSSIISE